MLEISSIKNGIVIDHIEQGQGYQIFKFLKLHRSDYTAALIMNVESSKTGHKDLIKISNNLDIDLGILGLFSDKITVNYIENEEVAGKVRVILPEYVQGILICGNPRCISNHERNMETSFRLINRSNHDYICDYCDHHFDVKEINK